MIKRYFSKYTGEQIDEAIGAIIENNIRLEDLSPDLIQTIKGWVSGLEALDGYVSITEDQKITGQKTFTKRPLLELEGLPKEYQAVEYIQSYGAQYIDTELSLPSGFEVEATFEITQTRSASGLSSALFGAQETGNKKRNYITVCGSSDQMLVGYGSDSGYTYFGKAEPNVKYRAKFNNIYGERTVNISGMNYTLTPWEEKVYTSSNLYLFAFNENGAAQNAGFIKLYSFIVKNSYGEMVGNYVPCYRKDTKEVGLYDIITNRWLSNKGSGTFSKGQDISRAVVITTLATTQDVDSVKKT